VVYDLDDVDVILRFRCKSGTLVRLNDTLNDFHKNTIRATVFSLALEYDGLKMNQHLTLALVKCWVY